MAADYSGGEYIHNAKRGKSDEHIRVRFEDDSVTTHLILAGRPGTVVTIGDGVGASVDDRVPMAVVARNGRDVPFAAVLEPVRTGGRPQVAGVRLTEAADGLTVAVELDGRTDMVKIRPDNGFSADLSQKP
jgi:hypothetical protein